MRSAIQVLSEHSAGTSAALKEKLQTKVENIIAAERNNLKDKDESETESDISSNDDEISSDSEDEVDDTDIAKNMAADKLIQRSEDVAEENDEEARRIKKSKKLDTFFAETKTATSGSTFMTFHQFNLSRPVLKAIERELGYTTPTLVQSSCIPIIQSGRDVCASAETGSGKTGAFLIPIVESLLFSTG